MRAIGVNRFGGADALELLDMADLKPGPGEALVNITYSGVNYIDIYMRSGAYKKSDTYKTPLPMVLGMEGAGHVHAVGTDVDEALIGQNVAYSLSRGSYAEQAVVPAWKLVPIPDDVPLDIACALQLQGCTAHYLTHAAYPLKAGDTCLIHAGAGGVGQLFIQIAKHLGATVITTVGSPDKADIAKQLGADFTILYREEDFLERVVAITNGQGVDVVVCFNMCTCCFWFYRFWILVYCKCCDPAWCDNVQLEWGLSC